MPFPQLGRPFGPPLQNTIFSTGASISEVAPAQAGALLSPSSVSVAPQASDTLAGVVDPVGSYMVSVPDTVSTAPSVAVTPSVLDSLSTSIGSWLTGALTLLEAYWWVLVLAGAAWLWYTHRKGAHK